MKLGIKLATLASAITLPALSYGIYALTNGTTEDNKQDTPAIPKEEKVAVPPVDPKPPEPPQELEKTPQVGQASSHETDEEKKQREEREIEEGKKEFENFTKTGNMPSQVRKIRLYFKSKGGPDNPGTEYERKVDGGCYHFNSGCPPGYGGMNNIYGGSKIRGGTRPNGFKG